MGTCLATTLKEAVSDTSLLKLGELRLHVTPRNGIASYKLRLESRGVPPIVTVTVSAPGYITDRLGAENLGRTATVETNHIYLIANKEYDIVLSSKYFIANLEVYREYANNVEAVSSDFGTELEDFMGMGKLSYIRLSADMSKGSIDVISTWNNEPRVINLSSKAQNGNLEGSIDVLSQKSPSFFVDLNLANNYKLTGSLGAISHLTSMQNLLLGGLKKVTGSLAQISNMTSLKTLDLSYTAVTGDTSALRNLTNLTTFTYTNTAITGNWPLV